MHPNIVSASQSGVDVFWLKLIGFGLSTLIPLLVEYLKNHLGVGLPYQQCL